MILSSSRLMLKSISAWWAWWSISPRMST